MVAGRGNKCVSDLELISVTSCQMVYFAYLFTIYFTPGGYSRLVFVQDRSFIVNEICFRGTNRC